MISRIVSMVSEDFFLVNPFCSVMASIKWDLVRVMVDPMADLFSLTIEEHELGIRLSVLNCICQENHTIPHC